MPNLTKLSALAAIAILNAAASASDSDLKLSELFSDHMVLQRETPIKITGASQAGETVVVKLNNASAEAKTDNDGAWLVQLPPQKAGGPFALTVSDSDETTTIEDILIGDVWVCGGQSNMAFSLIRSLTPQAAISQADNSSLRLYTVPQNKSLTPLAKLSPAGRWEISSPEVAAEFSAVGYYFGRELHRELDIPIGLIESAWGGTKVEWWTPVAGLQGIDVYKKELTDVVNGKTEEQLFEEYKSNLEQWVEQVQAADPGAGSAAWAAADFNDSSWEMASIPENKKKGYLSRNDGTVWYRRTFTATDTEASQTMTLRMDCVDDVATAYINGVKIARPLTPMDPHIFNIPLGTIKPGENTIALQVLDFAGDGGVCGSPDGLNIAPVDPGQTASAITLAGAWKFHPGTTLKNLPEPPTPPHPIRPTALYNAMIAPLQKFPIKGAIWYQGESNASKTFAPVYAETFGNMIEEWRKGWGVGDFPFLYVQIASFRKPSEQPEESNWAQLREQQENVLDSVKNTAMASAIDIGEEDDIHPRNKMDVGKRLALNALAVAYDRPVEYMGPIYKSYEVADGQISIMFTHADTLKTSGGEELKGFAVAGADGKFVYADARIDGNSVIVSSEAVKEPKTVRYGWANYSNGNLYNGANLPASPFRTDK